MYWSDWGNHPKIETAAMDGTLRETLVQNNIQWPTGDASGTPGFSPCFGKGWGLVASSRGIGSPDTWVPSPALGQQQGLRFGAENTWVPFSNALLDSECDPGSLPHFPHS